MIYFVGNLEQKIVKIGYTSTTVKARVSSIKTGCPFELTTFRVLEGKRNTESKLHSQFRDYRLRGEWFTLSEEIINYINQTKDFVKAEKSIQHKVTDNIRLFKGAIGYATIDCHFCRVQIDIRDTKEFYTDKHKNLIDYRIIKFIKFHPRTTELNKQIKEGVIFYIDNRGCICSSTGEVIRESHERITFKEANYLD